jgi:hypothetical protein
VTVSSGRLVVVLGYSDRRVRDLHPICARRLAHAASVSKGDDVVVLSGWARTPRVRPEAELMAAAWTGTCRELIVDPDARHTVANATNAFDDLARTGAGTVVVVTSRWHAPRARAIFAWVCRGSGTRVVTSSPAERVNWRRVAGEAARWLVLPFQLLAARRTVSHVTRA